MLNLSCSRMLKSVILVGGIATTFGVNAGDTGVAVDVSTQFLFVPKGFDTNDQTEVVLDGFLPSACYKVLPPVVKFDDAQKVFQITPRAFRFDGMVCGQYQVPYTVTAKLGVVPAGEYTVIADGAERKTLGVTRSTTPGPDDFLYAAVDQVQVNVDISQQSAVARISGHFTNSCMKWQESRLLDQGETIVLLPIVSMEEGADCHAVDAPYPDVEVVLPWRGPGRYLLHTRSLSGVAVNTVFTVEGE